MRSCERAGPGLVGHKFTFPPFFGLCVLVGTHSSLRPLHSHSVAILARAIVAQGSVEPHPPICARSGCGGSKATVQ